MPVRNLSNIGACLQDLTTVGIPAIFQFDAESNTPNLQSDVARLYDIRSSFSVGRIDCAGRRREYLIRFGARRLTDWGVIPSPHCNGMAPQTNTMVLWTAIPR